MQETHNQKSDTEQKQPEMEETLATDYVADQGAGRETGDTAGAPDLEQLLQAAELKAAEHQDAWLRARAEAENIRRRAQTDIANAHKYAIDNFSTELLVVMDSLDAALTAENSTLENLRDGVKLTRKQLATVFEKFNIHIVDPLGEKFDPNLHEAMCMVESELPPNTVTQVMRKGYVLHDRVIRPAMVAVSKAGGA